MNGSTEKRKPPIVLHGVGQQRERQRTDAERVGGIAAMRPVAAHWRMRPAVREPANPFSACRENWIDSSHTPGNGNSRASHSHGQGEHPLNNAVRCTRAIASKQTPCVCTRDPAPPGFDCAEPHRPRRPAGGAVCGTTQAAAPAFVSFPPHSCRTLAIVLRSSALRSIVSLRDELAPGCGVR